MGLESDGDEPIRSNRYAKHGPEPMEGNIRPGTTILECVIVIALIAILTAVAIPPFQQLRDGIAVHGAAAEAHALLATARRAAIHRSATVTVDLDTVGARIIVRTGTDTLRVRELGAVHGVHLATSRATASYGPTGLGYGASNLTLVVTRGSVADTLTVSRLGRVRRD